MNAALQDARQTPPVLGGLLVTIVILLLVSIGLQAGVVNPTAQSTQSEVRQIACAQAESTANAFRYRQVGPNGKLESREHFLTRMLAQRHTLLIASGTGCDSAPGFPPFDVQVARALREINEILGYRKRPTSGEPRRSEPAASAVVGSRGADVVTELAPSAGSPAAIDDAGGDSAPGQDDGGDPAAPPKAGSTTPPAAGGGDAPSSASPADSPAAAPTVSPSPAASPPAELPVGEHPGVVQTTVEKVDDAITPTVCAAVELLRGTCNP